MKTREFFDALRVNKGHALQFTFEDNQSLPLGYHITEVKNVQVDAVDCGGKADQWKETQIQLWVPAQQSERQIDTDKALGILEKVDAMIAVNLEATCFFEAENQEGIAILYEPSEIIVSSQALVVKLKNRRTQCKAIERTGNENACCDSKGSKSSCCS